VSILLYIFLLRRIFFYIYMIKVKNLYLTLLTFVSIPRMKKNRFQA